MAEIPSPGVYQKGLPAMTKKKTKPKENETPTAVVEDILDKTE
ncbi:hypothetical protein ACFL2Q_18620 [Thermodesulfobacteriota bacterium]